MKNVTLKNGGTVVIRRAKTSDAKGIVAYTNAISYETDFLTIGGGEFGVNPEQEKGFLENVSRQKNAVYLVADAGGGKIVGTACFIGGSRPRIEHVGEMSVSVSKAYWGNGIGTELTGSLIECCRQTGIIRKINLRVRTDNASAIHIYKKLGFVEAGVITRELKLGDFMIRCLWGILWIEGGKEMIERASYEDLEEILLLQKLAYQSEAEICNDFQIPPLTQTLKGIREDFMTQVILKTAVDGKIIGSVRAYEKDGVCCIGRLIVHPDHQNKGIGKTLMRAVEECFSGCPKYSLFTGKNSLRNLHFYGSLGYWPVKEEFVKENLTLVYLEKDVRA